MPQLIGMTLGAASLRLTNAGLHIASAQQPEDVPPPAVADPNAATGATPGTPAETPAPQAPAYQLPQAFSMDAVIASQSPGPGHRVTRGDSIRVTLARTAEPTP